MNSNGDVITLMPGSGSYAPAASSDVQDRKDWSPIAQPPGPDGVLAHTPDPAGYFDVGGRTMIPRAKYGKNMGGSRAFTPAPGKVNIDPADPVTGSGGLTVDLSSLPASVASKAAELGQGDPLKSWYAAAQLQEQSKVKNAAAPANTPQSQPTPQPPVSGGGVPMPFPASDPAPFPQAAQMSTPKPIQTPTVAAAPSATAEPQYAAAPLPAANPPQVHAPAFPDPVSQQMLQVLTELVSEVRGMKQAPPLTEDPIEAVEEPVLEREDPTPALAVPEDVGLPFLTAVPSPPKIQVIFDLGKGGRHLKRFHHVAIRGSCLSVLFDTRYEGDQFIPPATEEGDPPITITFPQYRNRKLRAYVPEDFNQRLGCLDQLNFIIIEDDAGSEDVKKLSDELRQGARI